MTLSIRLVLLTLLGPIAQGDEGCITVPAETKPLTCAEIYPRLANTRGADNALPLHSDQCGRRCRRCLSRIRQIAHDKLEEFLRAY